MTKAAQHVFFYLAQPHPFIKDGLYLYTEQNKKAAHEKGAACLQTVLNIDNYTVC